MTVRRTILQLAQATLYRQGEFGFNYHELEVRNLTVSLGSYAQYDRAVFTEFTPKGARRARGFVQTSYATLVVLEGWGHTLEPGGMFGPTVRKELGEGVTVEQPLVSATSCDASWNVGFRSKLHAYCAERSLTPAADFHGHDPYSRRSEWFRHGGVNVHVHPVGPYTWKDPEASSALSGEAADGNA